MPGLQEAKLLPLVMIQEAKQSTPVTVGPKWPELDQLTAFLIIVSTSNIGPTRESQIGTPHQSREAPSS